VQPLVGKSDIQKNSQSHVQYPPIFYPPIIEWERTASFLTPHRDGQEFHNRGSLSPPILRIVWKRTPK